jgi:hypothetical protein
LVRWWPCGPGSLNQPVRELNVVSDDEPTKSMSTSERR